MKQSNVEVYLEMMDEVKRRELALRSIMAGSSTTAYKITNIEFVYLQFRKILELVALGSLVANEDVYTQVYNDFATAWNARKMLGKIEQVNSDFYPKPILQIPSKDLGVRMDFVDPPADGWLSKEEFVELYNSCGAIVHADNPNGEKTDYADYEKKVPLWHKKITGLLNSHLIKLIDDPNIYLIQMGSPEERPSYTIFGPKVS